MSLARAFLTVSGMTMLSRVLGLAREILIVAFLGSSPAAQAFFVAFRFPNLFRRFFAEGAFNMAFVPMFSKRVADDQAATADGFEAGVAQRFGEEVQAGLLSVLFVLVLIAQLLMPWLMFAVAYGFADDPDKMALTVELAQIQFPYLLFMSLVALFSGVLNALGRFAVAAGAPVLFNIFMIAALLLGAGLVENAWGGEDPAAQEQIARYLAWSVFLAGLAQLLLVRAAARRAGMRLRLRAPRWTPDMKRMVSLGVPGAIAGGVTQLNILIGTTIATFFDGAVVWLTLADRIYQLPLGVIGVAMGVALLPELSRRVRAEDVAGA
ncbi:MAG: murein biosynthesis integral membrane protein MurJ, partial [Pseudomonadota bacterium]